MSLNLTKTSWQDKRIKAMNKIISKSKSKKETTEHYLAEYNRVCVSEAVTKKEYKKEYKGENNVSNN